jgi:hypothetical protein
MCFDFLYNILSETFLILRITERDIIKMYIDLHVQSSLFLYCFNETWIFSTDFQTNTQISNFMKIRPMGAELFHTDRLTNGHDEANSRFLQFCERASKYICVIFLIENVFLAKKYQTYNINFYLIDYTDRLWTNVQ